MMQRKQDPQSITREDNFDIAIIGSGFSGICMAIRLKQQGRNNFVILEKASELGGTWRENNYPGCACDVPSYLYSYSFEPRSSWSRLYAPHDEILDYLRHCADKYDLHRHIRLNTEVGERRFDEQLQRWIVETGIGKTISARIVVAATGGLSIPIIPKIEGQETFNGPSFHSAEWQHDSKIEGKKIAVIGTGASAIQVVPAIQPMVEKLDLYQRTPPWIMPKPDRAVEEKERSWLKRNPFIQKLIRWYIYWVSESAALGLVVNPSLMKGAQKKSIKHMHAAVEDPDLREKLTPSYTMGCKRILLSDDYYPALANPNTEVVTDSVVKITESGIVTKSGEERKADVIVWCTGFNVSDPIGTAPIIGRNARELRSDWKEGPEGYFGVASNGYPNYFFLVGPNTGLGHNSIIFVIEAQVEYILKCLDWMARDGLASIEVSKNAHEHFNNEIQSRSQKTVWESGCESWYTTDTGKNTSVWPGFSFEIRNRLKKIRKTDFDVRKIGGKTIIKPQGRSKIGSQSVS